MKENEKEGGLPEIGGIPETQEASATRQREVDEHGYELWLAVGDIWDLRKKKVAL